MLTRLETLTLIISGEVTFPELLTASQSFFRIVREIEHAVEGSAPKDAVTWIVSAARKKSVHLQVTGRLSNPQAPVGIIPTIVHAVIDGIDAVTKKPERPRFFSDVALQEAKALATLATISLKNGKKPTRLDRKLAENIEEIIGPKETSIGTVVGRIEGVTIHGRRIVVVYEQLSGRRVECSFRPDMQNKVLAGFGRRVSVYGVIRSNAAGDRLGMEIEDLEIFPSDSELPTAEDVRGILRN
jgi:hypothetical protein